MRALPKISRAALFFGCLCFLIQLLWIHGSASENSEGITNQENQAARAPTSSELKHAIEDTENVQKYVRSLPKDQRDAAAMILRESIQAEPEISDEFREKVSEDPRVLLEANPANILTPSKFDIVKSSMLIQQVSDPTLVPIAVLPGGLKPGFTPAPGEAINPLIAVANAKSAELMQVSQSVGRIEISQSGGSPKLIGTAFVVGRGYLMTACHVVKDIAQVDPATKAWKLTADTYIDFGKTTSHATSEEFVVRGVTRMSTVRGFDIGILQVDLKSRDADASLPPNLNLSAQQSVDQFPVAVIGYPSFGAVAGTKRTLDMMARVKASNPNGAKYISPGEVLSNEDRTLFHILVHMSSTHGGNSGSPVFSLSPVVQVVGIHYCCTGLVSSGFNFVAPDPGDCSSTAAADIHSNEAISSADARALIPNSIAANISATRMQHGKVRLSQHPLSVPKESLSFSQ